jgi:hypothetical protein
VTTDCFCTIDAQDGLLICVFMKKQMNKSILRCTFKKVRKKIIRKVHKGFFEEKYLNPLLHTV